MKARCPCTLEEQSEGIRIKPLDGYIEPDPNCKDCKGTGFMIQEVTFPSLDENVEAFWHLWCPKCNNTIPGFHCQFKGEPSPNEDCMLEPCCIYCDGDPIWVKDEEDIK